jgi:hypothetical protein
LQTDRREPRTKKEEQMQRPFSGSRTQAIVMTTVLALGVAIGMLYILVAA